jgi:hydrogenase/urease accessory protein HupE
MQMNSRKSMAALATGVFATTIASAHPGHAPVDFTSQISSPFAGVDHFLAFAGLTALLLTAFRLVLSWQRRALARSRK